MEPSKQKLPTVQLVCVGKIRSRNLVCWVFKTILPDGNVGEERLYSAKNLKAISVGSVYEVETDADDSTRIYVNSARWLRVWSNEEEAAVWQAAAAAFDTTELARKREKQETSRKLPLEVLRPLREEYWRTNAAGRLAIEVRVLAYLRLVSLNNDNR
jgi:hypothetical protein